ncbi:hypothetical protein K1T71_007353 [Dendrolimus kikuchii]|uniref:Uncharacterized protein n=1 Tax=Dendrolimus kikuchii TaxID=765133 RepID=A0ACC1D043_9NEOP|nr:hypothetical protein K1T71_007353 [Dendrolimus kikuchii]
MPVYYAKQHICFMVKTFDTVCIACGLALLGLHVHLVLSAWHSNLCNAFAPICFDVATQHGAGQLETAQLLLMKSPKRSSYAV